MDMYQVTDRQTPKNGSLKEATRRTSDADYENEAGPARRATNVAQEPLTQRSDKFDLDNQVKVTSLADNFNVDDDDELETNLDIKEKDDLYDETGERTYENACRKFHTVPSASLRRQLASAASIDIKHYGIGPRGAKALAIPMVMNTSVTSLCLKGNDLSQTGIKYITKMMAENTCITDLDLSDNKLGTYGAELISQMLRGNTSIRKLDISGNRFGDTDAAILSKSIEEHPELKVLNMSNNEFGERTGSCFKHMISENGCLQELDLSWNHIRRNGAIDLARGVKENVGLKQLNLAWNGFGDDGAKEMALALKTTTLTSLDMTCNRIHDVGFLALIKALKDNDDLRELKLGRNAVSEVSAIAGLEFILKLDGFRLTLLDLAENLYKKKWEELLAEVNSKHCDLVVRHGYTDSYGKRKLKQYNVVEEALNAMKTYCDQHSLNIVELFSRFDTDGSMSVTHDEFREGLKDAKIPLSALQVDELINALDQDGDGEIDFSELVLGAEMYDQEKP